MKTERICNNHDHATPNSMIPNTMTPNTITPNDNTQARGHVSPLDLANTAEKKYTIDKGCIKEHPITPKKSVATKKETSSDNERNDSANDNTLLTRKPIDNIKALDNYQVMHALEEQIRKSKTRKMKRILDLILASTGLLILSPLLPLIALAIKISSPGPIIYRQLRIGLCMPTQTALFKMIKFRTMRIDAESTSGAVWATKNDPRITPVGRLLRKTRLDEIPQLWNVIIGDMSLIGPRPERPGFYDHLENEIPYFAERTFGIHPGITGLAQVNQGYDTCIQDVRTKLGFDLSYALAIQSPLSCLRMDAMIIWKTLVVMVTGRGQ